MELRSPEEGALPQIVKDPLEGIDPLGHPYVLGAWHRDRVSLIGYKAELGAALRPQIGAGAQRKFLIIARPRSGTTLLCGLLDSVPGVTCEMEMLHFAVASPSRYLKTLARKSPTEVYGCKFLTYQMLEVNKIRDPRAFLDDLVADGFEIVHLIRRSFDQAFSLYAAQLVGKFKVEKGAKAETTDIVFDKDTFIKQLRLSEAQLAWERSFMAYFDRIEVQYERDLIGDATQQQTIDRFCDHFGVARATVSARVEKALSAKRTRVVNKDEIHEYVRQSEYSYLLEK